MTDKKQDTSNLQSILQAQLAANFDQVSRSLCVEHAMRSCSVSKPRVTQLYNEYIATAARENMRRLRSGPCLLAVVSRRKFSRLARIAKAFGDGTPGFIGASFSGASKAGGAR